jgi:uncharacterized protein YbaP (TraB family)
MLLSKYFIKPALLLSCFMATACGSLIKKPFLYEIEKDNRKSYVLGSLHVGFSPEDFPSFVLKKYEASNALVLEYLPEWMSFDQDEYVRKLGEVIADNKRKDSKISSKLPQATYEKVRQVFETKKYIPEFYDYLSLETVYSSMQVAVKPNNFYFVTNNFYSYGIRFKKMDLEFGQLAKKNNKPIFALDNQEILRPICSDKFYAEAIEGLFRSKAKYVNFDETLDAYAAGNGAQLQYALGRVTEASQQCLLDERNEHWVKTLKNLELFNSPLFIVVGALHVVGENNILDQLKKEGYAVRRIEQE